MWEQIGWITLMAVVGAAAVLVMLRVLRYFNLLPR